MTSRRPRDVVRELEHSPYFRGIPETLLHPIAVHAELARVGDGIVFAERGSPPDALYVVLSGKVDVLRPTPASDKPVKVSELQPGMLVGHVSALRDRPRQASYRAQGTVDLLQFSRDAVKRLLDDEGNLKVDTEDEVIAGALLTKDGEIVNERAKEAANK